MKVDFNKSLENTNKRLVHVKQRTRTFFKCRWSGLVMGPTYGLFLYFYLTYMIFSGPPFTSNPRSLNVVVNGTASSNRTTSTNLTENDQSCIIDDLINSIGKNLTNLNNGLRGNDSEQKNPFDKDYTSKQCGPLMTVETRYVINIYIECTTF